jgi:ankyrin repeat protein
VVALRFEHLRDLKYIEKAAEHSNSSRHSDSSHQFESSYHSDSSKTATAAITAKSIMSEPISSIAHRIVTSSDDAIGLESLLSNKMLYKKNERKEQIPNTFTDNSGNKTLLMLAAKGGRINCVKYLVSLDSRSVYAQNPQHGTTALHYACWHNQEDAAFALLELGANLASRCYKGETCLGAAIAGKHKKLVRSIKNSIYYVPELLNATDIQLNVGEQEEDYREVQRKKQRSQSDQPQAVVETETKVAVPSEELKSAGTIIMEFVHEIKLTI